MMAYGDDPVWTPPAPPAASPPVNQAPTITVRPAAQPPEQMPNAPRPPAAAVQSGPAGAKLSPDQITQEFTSLGYAPGGASGWAQNVMRESGGDPRNVGDNGTSHGLFQHHNERWDQLQAFAKEKGGDPYDPMMQIQFTDHEMQTQYPKLRAKLMDPNTSGAEGEEMIRRVFERPAAGGYGQDPKIRTDKFNFSDDALREHESDPDTDVVYMSPQDYLDLTPALGNSPKEQRDAASIRKSVAAGDSIDEIPSLNIQTGSKGSAVFGQDGRNRALLAQENGLDLIPVAIHREGDVKNPITEIEGMTGKILPYNYDKVPPPPPAKPGMLKSALMGAGEGFGKTSAAGVAGSFGRGLAPYAAAGGIGGALGGPPGALAGLALAGATDLGTTAYNAVAPHVGLPPSATLGTLTDMALDHLGLPRPQTATERTAEAAGAGVGNALSGSAAAKALAETAVNPLVKAVAGSLAEKPATQMAAGGLSAAASTIAKESGASPAVQFTAGALASVLPFAGPRMLYNAIKINPSQAAKDAIGAGYVLPPAEATEGSIAKVSPVNVMAGAGGKIKMEQFASAKNQAVTDGISARELGFPEKTLMDSTMLQHYRDMQGLPYGRLKSIQRPFQVDQQFQDDISALAREARIAGSEYSQMKSPELEAMLKDLTAKGEYSPTAMIERIKALRQDSVSNLSSPAGKQVAYKDLSLGTAQRGAAMAMEDLIERNLAKTNQVHLLDDVRTARVNIAKSYDIETALNDATHQVSARRLAALQNRGKPLAGGLKTIADAANNFERSFQTPTKFGAVESLSVLDVSFAGMAAARSFIHGDVTQGLAFMAAAGIRPLARAAVMNKSFQQKMVGIVKPSLAQPSGALSPFVLYPGLQMLMGNKGDQQ
jgi:hypothetical protein